MHCSHADERKELLCNWYMDFNFNYHDLKTEFSVFSACRLDTNFSWPVRMCWKSYCSTPALTFVVALALKFSLKSFYVMGKGLSASYPVF